MGRCVLVICKYYTILYKGLDSSLYKDFGIPGSPETTDTEGYLYSSVVCQLKHKLFWLLCHSSQALNMTVILKSLDHFHLMSHLKKSRLIFHSLICQGAHQQSRNIPLLLERISLLTVEKYSSGLQDNLIRHNFFPWSPNCPSLLSPTFFLKEKHSTSILKTICSCVWLYNSHCHCHFPLKTSLKFMFLLQLPLSQTCSPSLVSLVWL